MLYQISLCDTAQANLKQHFMQMAKVPFRMLQANYRRMHRKDALNSLLSERGLNVALQILGQKSYKNTRISSFYSQSLLIFIHRTR